MTRVNLVATALAVSALLVAPPALAYGPRASPACVTGPAAGTTWYACDCYTGDDGSHQPQSGCTIGNNGNAGTSAASPLQTIEAARAKFVSAHDGDRVALCEGGVFNPSSDIWDNANFTVAGGGGQITKYTAGWGGGGVRPIVAVPANQNGFAFVSASAVHGPYLLASIAIHGHGASGDPGQEFGIFAYGRTTNVTACDMLIEGMGIGMSSARNVETDRVPNMILRDSIVQNNWAQGWLGGDSGGQVLFNKFYQNGTRSGLDHNIYFVGANGSDPTQPTIGVLIQGNDVSRTTWTAGTGCQATEIVAHGLIQNFTIDGNWVHEDVGTVSSNCWGIAPAPSYPYAEEFDNVSVRNNRIENVGNVSIAAGSWNGGFIENNVFVNLQSVNDKAISMSELECHTTGVASCSDANGSGGGGGVDFTLSGVTARNNSFLLDVGTAVSIRNGGSGYYSVNNAAYFSGGTGPCFDFPLSAASYTGVDYNDCFISGGTGNHWQGAQSLATWTGASGFDTHSLTTTPAFLSITSPYNLAVLNTSPLYNAGSTALGSATDITGVTRPQSTATDIGAYELVAPAAAIGRAYLFLSGGGF